MLLEMGKIIKVSSSFFVLTVLLILVSPGLVPVTVKGDEVAGALVSDTKVLFSWATGSGCTKISPKLVRMRLLRS